MTKRSTYPKYFFFIFGEKFYGYGFKTITPNFHQFKWYLY